MCGICGYMNSNEKIKNDSIISKMSNSINRRGPDALHTYIHGNVALGHTRLSIIDLLTGGQPMHYEYNSNKYTITYNGELYNTKEIEEELLNMGFSFNTKSDTEVILVS